MHSSSEECHCTGTMRGWRLQVPPVRKQLFSGGQGGGICVLTGRHHGQAEGTLPGSAGARGCCSHGLEQQTGGQHTEGGGGAHHSEDIPATITGEEADCPPQEGGHMALGAAHASSWLCPLFSVTWEATCSAENEIREGMGV